MEYMPAKRISLKASADYNEEWLQKRIEEDVTLLGLGELIVHDRQRIQPKAGRLDLLLSDPPSGTRYVVEIQLGATNESHIMRTVEYWDIEKSRYPQFEHVAVLIAEDITSRFLNVISLFNKAIPIIAIQLNALEVAGYLTLSATTVLDLMRRGTDEEDEPGQPVDRAYWEANSFPSSMTTMDALHDLVQEATGDPSVALKYNKAYVGLARHGIADNFVIFFPRKSDKVLTSFKLDKTQDLAARVEAAGLDVAEGFKRPDRYYVRLIGSDLKDNRELLTDMIRTAANLPDASGSE